MERVLGIRMENRPLSAGSFAANLRSFETVRDFITSATVTAFIDLPFALVFLLVMFQTYVRVLSLLSVQSMQMHNEE